MTASNAPEFKLRPQQFRKIPAGRIDPHPDNWRIHTDQQKHALTGVLAEVGFVGTILVRPHGKDKQGERYQCLDGHERLSRFAAGDAVPCLVVKMTDEEAAKFLATYDTITGLAATDVAALKALTAGLEWEHAGLDDLIADTLAGAEQLVDDALDALVDDPEAQSAADMDDEPEAQTPADRDDEPGKSTTQKVTLVICPECQHEFRP